MADKDRDVHIVSVDVSNIHRLSFAEVKLNGTAGLVRVTGKNKVGKSSLLRAIRMALGGGKQELEKVVREGTPSKSGQVVLELTNGYTVSKVVREDGKSRLVVKDAGGGKHGQTKLNELMGPNHDFDLLNFFKLKVARQIEILFSLSPDKKLAGDVQVVRAVRDAHFDERTPHLSEQTRCRKIAEPFGERPELIDMSAAVEELEDLRKLEDTKVATILELERVESYVGQGEEEIEDLTSRLDDRTEALESNRKRLLELRTQYDGMDDHNERVEELKEEIANVGQVQEWMKPWDEYDRAQESLVEATEKAETLTVLIDEAKATERELMAKAGIPVEGLTFDDDTEAPLLNGLPLAVASGAERIRMALDVAIATDPALKIVLIDEANDLDLDALAALEEEAIAQNFQVWCCRLDQEVTSDVFVEDGKATSKEA